MLLADEMGLGKTYTVLAAALFAKTIAHSLMSRQDCPLSVFFGRTLRQWQDEVEQGFPGLSEEQRGWYPCTHPRPVPRRFLQLLLDQGEATQDVAPWHPVLCVVLPSVRETFLAATRTITSGTRFAVRDLSGDGGMELGHTHLNFSMSHPKRMWDIHVITYNAFTERAQRNPSGSPRQLTDCTWSWGIFDQSHRYKGPKSIGWRVAMKAEIGFKVQVTATPAYHSLRDWANLSRWLFAIPHEVEVAESVSRHGPVALGKAVANVQRAVSKALPPDEQQAAAAEMIEVARPWTIRRWTESKLESGPIGCPSALPNIPGTYPNAVWATYAAPFEDGPAAESFVHCTSRAWALGMVLPLDKIAKLTAKSLTPRGLSAFEAPCPSRRRSSTRSPSSGLPKSRSALLVWSRGYTSRR